MPQSDPSPDRPADLFVIGGGVNGCGIARDAAGRGLRVVLAEQGDLAQATSSASTKLFHGGLRYLEYFELRLVREALHERETLLRAMPHISWPMRFVLPLSPGMRFDSDTPASRLLARLMPWMRGRRPAWMIRAGLFLYDHMGGRQLLPATRTLSLPGTPEGAPLQNRYARAFEYSDCWVDDARLVVLTAQDAARRGAEILTRRQVVAACRQDGLWRITLRCARSGAETTRQARALVNAAGPWVGALTRDALEGARTEVLRLVRGSHIVTRRLFDHDKAYFFQGGDGRIIFAIPYERDFTLIGTTDADHPDPDTPPRCTEAERDYLCAFASEYFRVPVTPEDVVWTYSGVRPLHDDGGGRAQAATRDYVLHLDDAGAAPLLNVLGGKITTYRKLSQAAVTRLCDELGHAAAPWTAGAPLPGGDFPVGGAPALVVGLRRDYPFLTEPWAARLVRAYGTQARDMLGTAATPGDLGRDFGATLHEAELRWLIAHEWAQEAEDVLWRRGKLGLRLDADRAAALADWLAEQGLDAAPTPG